MNSGVQVYDYYLKLFLKAPVDEFEVPVDVFYDELSVYMKLTRYGAMTLNKTDIEQALSAAGYAIINGVCNASFEDFSKLYIANRVGMDDELLQLYYEDLQVRYFCDTMRRVYIENELNEQPEYSTSLELTPEGNMLLIGRYKDLKINVTTGVDGDIQMRVCRNKTRKNILTVISKYYERSRDWIKGRIRSLPGSHYNR